MIDIIYKRLDQAINNFNITNFEELFPIILDDLEYVLVTLNEDEKKLSSVEQFMNGSKIRKKVFVYISKLATLYFKLIYNMDVNIINSSDYNLSIAGGGYNSKDGNIYYSDFGAILSQTSELSFLHTCLHEGRHQMQHESYTSESLLSIPPYMLKLLKESLLEDSLHENNRKFYTDNYHNLFTENDAEHFAKEEIYDLIKKLLYKYLQVSKKTTDNIDPTLMFKISKMNYIFNSILIEENFEIKDEVISEIYNPNIYSSTLVIGEEETPRLIATDKYIKAHPELQDKYPILRLLFNVSIPKSYEELIEDIIILKENKSIEEQHQIDALFNEIVLSDPILLLTDLLVKGDLESVSRFMEMYPTITSEYPKEIESLKNKYGSFGPTKK